MEDDVKQSSADRYALSQAHRWKAERDVAMQELRQLKKEVEGRLMPKGMEWLLDVWPKWSNGEYCKFGDWWKSDKYGETEPKKLRKLAIYSPEQLREWNQDDGDHFGYEWDFMRPANPRYRPDKIELPAPEVRDADGVPIHVGDDLYSIEGSLKLHVSAIDKKSGRIATEAMFALDKWADPKMYTHQRPVLDADGVKIYEGEMVYDKDTGSRFSVSGFSCDCVVCTDIDTCESDIEMLPSQLTHTKPELDTWEKVEHDAQAIDEMIDSEWGGDPTDARDLIRRAKALAEKEG